MRGRRAAEVCPEGQAIVSSEVAFDADGAISGRLEQGVDRRSLALADLQGQQAPGPEEAGSGGDDALREFGADAVGSGDHRLVAPRNGGRQFGGIEHRKDRQRNPAAESSSSINESVVTPSDSARKLVSTR